MEKIAEINCGCEKNCGRRIKLYWDGSHIIARDPHGREYVVEQHYSRTTKAQAIEDLMAMYNSDIWGLSL